MARTLILGTAGHVDHGKTALVRALTGIDTDRLDEEQRRGISIELGFAVLDLGDDIRLGIVDVPGHERFVRQMVAGAGGMDLAMLLVAADEGLMPQTHEHLDVLELLGVRAGLIVLTKMDLADRELLPLLEEEIRERVAGGFLADAPMLHVSARTGDGLDDLRAALAELARAQHLPRRDGSFRLPIDRVFSLEGTGLIAAGTAWSGQVRREDVLRLLPGGKSVRVRDVQSHGSSQDFAGAGQRVALALHGVKREEIARGDQLVSGDAIQPSTILGVRVRGLAALGERPLRHRARLHVHHAAREVLGRIELLEGDVLGPGDSALARLHLEDPLMALPGDRIVLRSYSPMLTIAGAQVLDAEGRTGERRARVLDTLRAFEAAGMGEWPLLKLRQLGLRGEARARVAGWLGALGNDEQSASRWIDARCEDGRLVSFGDRLVSGDALEALAERLLLLLRSHQSEQPMSAGLPKEQLRQAIGVDSAAHFHALLDAIRAHHPIFVKADRIRADSAEPELQGKDAAAAKSWLAKIRAAEPAYTPSRADMQERVLHLLAERGDIVLLSGPLWMDRSKLDAIVERVRVHLRAQPSFGIAEMKEWTGASRKYVVPILEWLDREGYTRFDGSVRSAGPKLVN